MGAVVRGRARSKAGWERFMQPRRICVVTGTRAEFGLLRWLMDVLAADPRVDLICLATGSHLDPTHGSTVAEIDASGHEVTEAIPILTGGDRERDIAAAFASGVTGLQDAFERHRPDIVVLLGDRYETLAAATAAMFCRLPIAHLHGGESTEGLIDEAVRHAVTKLSHLHFTAHETYRRRVLQLGEDPDRVWNVGALGAEAAMRTAQLDDSELELRLGTSLPERILTITVHPLTLDPSQDGPTIEAILTALESESGTLLVFTLPNADQNHVVIRERILSFVSGRENAVAVPSLGQEVYISLMRRSQAVIGNSSSGILEAPTLRVPAIDIGDRQRGRLRPASVLHCEPVAEEIRAAIEHARSAGFRAQVQEMPSPFGDGSTSHRVAERLRDEPLDGILFKRFTESV
jgi:UDP-hydrolysing UDP-N-acetyl-D-glucosamine 2-epimerase